MLFFFLSMPTFDVVQSIDRYSSPGNLAGKRHFDVEKPHWLLFLFALTGDALCRRGVGGPGTGAFGRELCNFDGFTFIADVGVGDPGTGAFGRMFYNV